MQHQQVEIPVGSNAVIFGDVTQPELMQGLVVFAHGSGSSRKSPRNREVADRLNNVGIGTLLADLLTTEEAAIDQFTSEHRFDIELLAARLCAALDWVRKQPLAERLPIGLYGASTGAAAALKAAHRTNVEISAIVSRGGRPDLAGRETLEQMEAPTLLIVGGFDTQVVELNKQAYSLMGGEKDLVVIQGATHLFAEAGALEQAAEAAVTWFERHLRREPPSQAVI